jgi:uncharacterized protein (TIGR00730 family)
MRTVTVFGSSLPREGSAAYAEARRLGELLAKRGFALANGGYAGLMEATARGAREAGGHTLGVTCAIWPAAANRWIAEEVRTQSFLERLTTLVERGDAYIVLPGGTGTLAELALVWEMMHKSALSQSLGGRKPLVVMVPYWQAVIDCLSQETSLAGPTALRRASAMDFVTTVSNAEQAVEILLEKL